MTPPDVAADRDALLNRVAVLEAELHDRDLRIAGLVAETRRLNAENRRLVLSTSRGPR